MSTFRQFLSEAYLIEDVEAVKRQYSHIPEEDFYKIISLDPTYVDGKDSVGKYSKWLLGLYKKDNPLNYTANEISELLSGYDKLKNDRNYVIEKDINRFKSITDLETAVNSIETAELSHRQEVRNRQQARKNVNLVQDADLVYEDSDWLVYVPKTYAASCKLGQGTSWCTASTESDDYYKNYTKEGPLYININKHNPSEKYQFHFESDQFMDKNDEEIDIYDFFNKYPKLEKFYDENTKYEKPCKPDENGLLIYDGGKIFDKENIKKVIVEDGVTSIGYNAFSHCKNLKHINIPDSVTSIGYNAFSHCKNLKHINIPDSVTEISKCAFLYCTSLASIHIPDSVTSIGEYAFYNCNSLTSIDIPNSVTYIGRRAFHFCNSLTSINIPNSVTRISCGAFLDCTSLKSINIPNSVTYIGDSSFGNCHSLTSITIPNSVTIIGEDAFLYCTSLTSIAIPNSVTDIGYDTFEGCKSLTITCEKGSVADKYAQDYDIPVKYM